MDSFRGKMPLPDDVFFYAPVRGVGRLCLLVDFTRFRLLFRLPNSKRLAFWRLFFFKRKVQAMI
jgi:hypothetical protein